VHVPFLVLGCRYALFHRRNAGVGVAEEERSSRLHNIRNLADVISGCAIRAHGLQSLAADADVLPKVRNI